VIKDLLMTNPGDIVLDNHGMPTYIYGQTAIEQIIRNTVKIWAGEWFRDTSRGIDWPAIVSNQYSKAQIIEIISIAILKIKYIQEIVDISFELDNTNSTVTMTYTILADSTIINGSVAI